MMLEPHDHHKINLKLGAINLKFDNLQESLQLYQHEINDAQGLLLTSQR
jgi:hypothetical protein